MRKPSIETTGERPTVRHRALTTLPLLANRLRRDAALLAALGDDAGGATSILMSDEAAVLLGVARRVMGVAIEIL